MLAGIFNYFVDPNPASLRRPGSRAASQSPAPDLYSHRSRYLTFSVAGRVHAVVMPLMSL